ncbi:MAG TPA: hypothetical protein VLT85_08960 [Terriglobales bacterium]|nr:hypothetical protein [Terriglobales bacterium]
MYIERKEDVTGGPARIGRVKFSQSGRSLYYRNLTLQKSKGGKKWNCFDVESGDAYWVSGCKKNGGDRLYCGPVEIDDDVREEYWVGIRKMPEKKAQRVIQGTGKYTR